MTYGHRRLRVECGRHFGDGDSARGAGMAQAGLNEGEHPMHHSDRTTSIVRDYVAAPGRPVCR